MNDDTQYYESRSFRWLVADFVTETAGVDAAAVVTSAGEILAGAPQPASTSRANAIEGLASVVYSLTKSAGKGATALGFGVMRHVLVEFGDNYLVIAPVSGDAVVGAVVNEAADVGRAVEELERLCGHLGELWSEDLLGVLRRERVA